MPERIVITAVGLTSPLGNDLTALRHHSLEGQSGLVTVKLPHIGTVVAGKCHFDPLLYQTGKSLRHSTRAGSIAIYCACQALEKAHVKHPHKKNIGTYIGITEHGIVNTEQQLATLQKFQYDLSVFDPYQNPKIISNNPSGSVALHLQLKGPAYTLGGACASGLLGIIEGARALQLNECDIALCGGVGESIQSFISFASFLAQGALSRHTPPQEASRPFDAHRTGLVVSEGGCLLTLERESHARERQAPILGVLKSYHVSNGGTHLVMPDSQSQVDCMESTIQKAGLVPADIDFINTHATGTQAGDLIEASSIHRVFGVAHPQVPVNNLKGLMGHTMGASGALELVANLPSFQDGYIHPCTPLHTIDPALPPLHFLKTPQESHSMHFLKNAFGMLGICTCVIVASPQTL